MERLNELRVEFSENLSGLVLLLSDLGLSTVILFISLLDLVCLSLNGDIKTTDFDFVVPPHLFKLNPTISHRNCLPGQPLSLTD